VLREAGLVEAEPAGRYTYYQLVPGPLFALADSLAGLAVQARDGETIRRPCP
jgi:ArsR family transcriptional regulator